MGRRKEGFRAGFGVLTGDAQIGADGQRGAGDRNGRGSFSGIFQGDTLCYGLTVTNIRKPIAAHIHEAPRGANGEVVVTLKQPRTGNPGASKLHNAPFPGRAVRGQIFSR